MIMEARHQRLSTPLQWGRREKAIIGSLLALVLVAAVALGAYGLTSGGGKTRSDCVEVTFASTLGGAKVKGCGQRARAICASGSFRSAADELRLQCRRLGFAYRPPS